MITRTVPLAYLVLTMAFTTFFADANPLLGQEEKTKAAEGSATPGEPPAAKRAKPRGRLPVYYSRVVSQDQREQIYGLQAKFQAEIDKLLAQLKQLEEQRDADVRKVLTDDQREKVDALVAEAKARREARRKETASKTGETPESTP